MSVDISDLMPINLNIGMGGIGNANFASAVVFADSLDLAPNVKFDAGTYRDYSSLSAAGADFSKTSEAYQILSRWFSVAVGRPAVSVYLKQSGKTPVEQATAFAEQRFRFFQFFKNGDLTKDTLPALGAWCDAEKRGLPVTLTDANVVGTGNDDLGTLLRNLQFRHIFPAYKSAASIAADPSQAYAHCSTVATFTKFDPNGANTAIDTEYQSLPGITPDNLSATAINTLKRKRIAFFSRVASAGEESAGLPLNTWSTSPNEETIDDVVNIDVLGNHLQNDGFNYITSSGRKRALTPQDFAGLIAQATTTLKRFYNNGVLGEADIRHPLTGEKTHLSNGFIVLNDPAEVLDMSASDRHKRTFPPLNIVAVLSRSGRNVSFNLNVE